MQALFFILDAVVDFFSMIFLLRFYMQWQQVSLNNPFGQFVMQITNWAVLPLRRFVPSRFGLDFASLIPVLPMQAVIKYMIITSTEAALVFGSNKVAGMIFWQTLVGTMEAFINLLILIAFLFAILSWINPSSPLMGLAQRLSQPVLTPIQRVLPPVANVDLSPLVAIVLLQAIRLVL